MGLGAENGKVKVESWDISKSKVRRKKKKKDDDDGVEEEDTGCWLRLRFFGSCISSRSKVDTSISGTSTHCGNFLYFLESIFTSCYAASFLLEIFLWDCSDVFLLACALQRVLPLLVIACLP